MESICHSGYIKYSGLVVVFIIIVIFKFFLLRLKFFIWLEPINLNWFKNYTKGYDICVSKVSKREEKEGKYEKALKKMTENFPNLGENIHEWIQEAERTPNKINSKKYKPRNIIVKILKTKIKSLKEMEEAIAYLWKKNNLNNIGFLIRNPGGQKEET